VTNNANMIHLVSLGCARNLVDSELMLGRLAGNGYGITGDPARADVIIVNTCSFIDSAVDESIDTILELARFKTTGNCRRLIVAGCLPERFREQIADSMPEVDLFLGTGAYGRIADAVQNEPGDTRSPCILPDPESAPLQSRDELRVKSSPFTAYLKIAEGCNKTCTFCMIPKLRGGLRSRSGSDIVAEALLLKESGIKEITLIAQDSTCYGTDLMPAKGLDLLLEDLARISNGIWLRILYGHPESINDRIIKTVGKYDNICSYFDIPIQHAGNRVLKRMGRRYTMDYLKRLFDKIRSHIPDACILTTAIVGYPGETDEDFQTLLEFIEEIRFDHLGVFTYSDSEELASHRLPGHVSQEVAEERYNLLMSSQSGISYENNKKYLNKTLQVLVEEGPTDGHCIGRTCFQAPEVDGVTMIRPGGKGGLAEIKKGRFMPVRITDALEYDLKGVPA